MPDAPLSEALVALSRFLVADASLGDTLHQVVAITTKAVPASAFAGLSLLDERGRTTTAVFTDEQSPEIDSAQYEEGAGPCLDAYRQKRVVRIDDMSEATSTYPKFARAAMDHGIHSTLSLPVIVSDQGLGAINLYATETYGFSTDDEDTATELATAASVVLANAQAYWRAFDQAETLSEAMKSRAVIEQAKGILMARSPSITAQDAFDLLVKASQRENVKLRELAQRIVDRRPPPEGGR
ncbi:MAG: hypothetical protein QOK43_1592 [Acidimicrobiaceae bacterium]|nr:hypothetical protein [Acidimicrobiaceae bacterium]